VSAIAAEANKSNLTFICRVLPYQGFDGQPCVAITADKFGVPFASRL